MRPCRRRRRWLNTRNKTIPLSARASRRPSCASVSDRRGGFRRDSGDGNGRSIRYRRRAGAEPGENDGRITCRRRLFFIVIFYFWLRTWSSPAESTSSEKNLEGRARVNGGNRKRVETEKTKKKKQINRQQ